MQSYCVKCKTMREIKNAREVKVNGRKSLKGECKVCGTHTSKFV